MAHSISDSDSDATFDPTEQGRSLSPRNAVDIDSSDAELEEIPSDQSKHNYTDRPGTSKTAPLKGQANSRSSVHVISESDDSDSEAQQNSKTCMNGKRDNSRTRIDEISTNTISTSKASTSAASSPPLLERKDTVVIESDTTCEELPMCRYGSTCYRKNPSHFKEFRHPFDSHGKHVS